MSSPGFAEVTGLALDHKMNVFPGHLPGSPLFVRDNTLHLRAGDEVLSIPELWAAIGPDRGVHLVHEETIVGNLYRFSELLAETFDRPTTVAWAMKAMAVRGVAELVASTGTGADVGSDQELRLALDAGIEPRKIICTSVVKEQAELETLVACGATSILDNEIEAMALESVAASAGKVVPVGVRINPAVDVPTHDMIATGAIGSKFGIPIRQAHSFIQSLQRYRHLRVEMVHMHVGAHFYKIDPHMVANAINREMELVHELRRDFDISRVDIGGGFRFPFVSPAQAIQLGMSDDAFQLATKPNVLELTMNVLRERCRELPKDIEVITEPGTAIVAGAATTLGQVLGVREVATIRSPFDGRHVAAGWVLGTASTSEFLLKLAVPNLCYQTCIAHRAEEDDFAAGVGGPLCFAGDILSPPGTFMRMARPERGDILCFANTGAYIGCGTNFHNLPRFPIALVGRNAEVRLLRSAEPHDPMARVEAA